MALYSVGLIIGLIFPARAYFCFIFFSFFVVGEWWGGGGGGQGLIIRMLWRVIFNEKSFRLLGIRVKLTLRQVTKLSIISSPF